MKRKWMRAMALVLALMSLCGCAKPAMGQWQPAPTETTEATVPVTVPADGDPNDVTCQGSYTGEGNVSAVVASLDGAKLTNSVLNAYYWATVAEYQAGEHEIAPDFDQPLDIQPCPLDNSVNSWQQYFLALALNNWHASMALKRWGDTEGLEPEEAYKPNLENHAKYMTGMPAMKYHYSYNLETFHPNTLHQAYLDNIPQLLKELAQEKGYADDKTMAKEAFGTSVAALREAVEVYNRGYMYFTTRSYEVEIAPEELDAPANGEKRVDLRQIFLVPKDLMEEGIPYWKLDETQPKVLEEVMVAADGTVSCSEAAWAKCQAEAEALLKDWLEDSKRTEYTFADLARKNSEDPGSTINGGSYRNIRQGQLTGVLDAWCFDPARVPGDTAVLRSAYGIHILYFAAGTEETQVQQKTEFTAQKQTDYVETAKKKFPMKVSYEKIVLAQAEAAVSWDALLYPDVAHERYPEAPVYLQQDYAGTMYGGFELRTNGCGITTMAMLATYMSDDELTPPEMCARYGNYSYQSGTDGQIFVKEPAVMGFYCKKRSYDPREVKQALYDGYVIVSVQAGGYWTRGGHYLLVEEIFEDDMVQVRDSNIFNYGRLKPHKDDLFKWSYIPPNGTCYWIFEKKVTAIPACVRCGQPEGVVSSVLEEDYLCEKCTPAILRRSTYQTACAQS